MDGVVVSLDMTLIDELFSNSECDYVSSYTLLLEIKRFMERHIALALLNGRVTSLHSAFTLAITDILDMDYSDNSDIGR